MHAVVMMSNWLRNMPEAERKKLEEMGLLKPRPQPTQSTTSK